MGKSLSEWTARSMRLCGEGIFDFLGEHALGADLGECDFLEAIAGGFDDLDFDFVTLDAEQFGDVIGLPEGELRAATADAEFHRRASIPDS